MEVVLGETVVSASIGGGGVVEVDVVTVVGSSVLVVDGLVELTSSVVTSVDVEVVVVLGVVCLKRGNLTGPFFL